MRICLFISGLAGGGAERVFLTLAESFVAEGLGVDLVVAKGGGSLTPEVPAGVRLFDLNSKRLAFSALPFLRYLNREKPTVILSALPVTNCIAVGVVRMSRKPLRVVISEHNTLSQAVANAQNLKSRQLPKLMRWCYRQADKIVAVSTGVADDLSQTLGLPRDSIEVIHNPIVTAKLEKLAQEKIEHPWFKAGQPPVVIGVGRLIPQKDFGTLIKAFSLVKAEMPAKLLILGEGPDRKELEGLVEELGLQNDVDMPGFVANPYAYMRHADVFVLSSRWEGFGNVLVEAMATGTPVVSTNCPSGPSEILENGKWGKLVGGRDAKGLSRSIVSALDGEGINAQQRAFIFRCEQAAESYLKVLHGG